MSTEGIAGAVPGASPEAPISIGVVGLGRSGWGIHATFLAQDPKFRLHAVADPMGERRAEAVEKLGVAKGYATPEELFADPDVELVMISTPSHTHKELARSEERRVGKECRAR